MGRYGPRKQRTPHNPWFQCGLCLQYFQGKEAYLDHNCPDLKSIIGRLSLFDKDVLVKKENLRLPTDIVFRAISFPELEPKGPAVKRKKS